MSVEYGVKHKDGHVEQITEESANEGYMTALQYARVRAEVSGGEVVRRTTKVTKTKWGPLI